MDVDAQRKVERSSPADWREAKDRVTGTGVRRVGVEESGKNVLYHDHAEQCRVLAVGRPRPGQLLHWRGNAMKGQLVSRSLWHLMAIVSRNVGGLL